MFPSSLRARSVPDQCPCDTALPYAECCGPVHDGRPAATAVALMRSRYSAFALGLDDHLFRTWHPRTRPAEVGSDPPTTWTGLVVHGVEAGGVDDETGVVEFTAGWRGPEGSGDLHEVSRFARRAGRWLYLDGQVS